MNVFLIFNFINLIIAGPIELRGIVEGFYGTPWTFDDRADLIQFSGKYKLNAYIYAPKDDAYHRDKWRIPYPEDKLKELENLISIAIENDVRFIFAVSPGLDLDYSEENDFNALMTKLDSIYEIGGRDFAIFFDDINADSNSGKNQANFLNKVYKELSEKYSDFNSLMTVPTEYWYDSMIDKNGNVKTYTKDFSSLLNKNIIVLYTGNGVVCDGITDEDFQKAVNIYNRDLGIWWNYPVNDFLPAKLALGPIEKLPKKYVKSIFFNPMQQVQLSKIALATGADYSYFPESYDSIKSWNNVINIQFKEIAEEMKIFANHSMHMENSWAYAGPADAPDFYKEAHQAVLDTKEDKTFDFSKLLSMINEMEDSADTLLEKLENNILSECKLHLLQFKRIIKADRIAVNCLQDKKLYPELKEVRSTIETNESQAILSEKSAIKFIDEVLDLLS